MVLGPHSSTAISFDESQDAPSELQLQIDPSEDRQHVPEPKPLQLLVLLPPVPAPS
jgi:hypothetical protein